MNKIIFLMLTLVFLQTIHADTPLPLGKWNYNVVQNGESIGSATITRKIVKNTISTSTKIKFKSDHSIIISDELIQENRNFTPIHYTNHSTLVKDDSISRLELTVQSTQNTLLVLNNNELTKFKVKNPVYFGINNLLFKALNKKFVASSLYGTLYEPSLNLKKLIKITITIQNSQAITISNKELTLNQLTFFIQDPRSKKKEQHMIIYCDNQGIIYLYRINLFKNPIEFVLIS